MSDTAIAVQDAGGGGVTPTRGMLQQAVSAGAPVDVIERLIALVERENAKDARAAFNAAFAAVKKALPSLPKNGIIPKKHGGVRSRFVKRDDLHRALTPILTAYGLSTSFSFRDAPNSRITCIMKITHDSGHVEVYKQSGPWLGEMPETSALQKSAGARSFLKRLVMLDAFDILDEDVDDDASGMGPSVMVSEAAALELEDMLQECENRTKGARLSGMAWVEKEFRVSKLADLTAPDALKVKAMFAKKLGAQ